MSVKIRLKRMGARNRPFYRVVVQDSRRAPTGRFIENIGYYDPMRPNGDCVMKLERFEYWKSVGAIPSTQVKNLAKRAIPHEKTLQKPEQADAVAAVEEVAAAIEESPAVEETSAAESESSES